MRKNGLLPSTKSMCLISFWKITTITSTMDVTKLLSMKPRVKSSSFFDR